MKEKIKVIINNFDPLEVLPYAPDDEYDFEVDKISKYFIENENCTYKHLGKFIYNLFMEQLTESAFFHTLEQCEEVAKSILLVYNNQKW